MKESLMRKCVDDLARVKSQQDIPGALAIYHADAKLVTIGLNVEANGSQEIEQQLRIFFTLFPDYWVDITQVACNDQVLLATGMVHLSPSIPNHHCKTVQQPACFVFQFKDGRIFEEEFYLDFGQVCQKANISIEQLSEATNQYIKFQTGLERV